MENQEIGALEAILFAAGHPVAVEELAQTLGCTSDAIHAACQTLADGYVRDQRGIRLLPLDGHYQMVSAPVHAQLIRATLTNRKPDRLSRAALEVLAVIAYHQPTTRAYLEQLRGVDSAYTVNFLLDREFIEECGRLPVPGAPILYRTTQNFLRTFQLTSLDDLPTLPEP